jgi:hypothetical protein
MGQVCASIMSALRVWAEGFARVIGLDSDVSSEAFDAFSIIVDKELASICPELETDIRKQLCPQLQRLLDTTLILDTLHALQPHHFALLQNISAKVHESSGLNKASKAYVALRAQLCVELPTYLKLLNAGVTLCVGQLVQLQVRLWRDLRARWSDLWDVTCRGGDESGK